MPKIIVVGDVHLDRSLPYKQILEDGTNDRYNLRLRLLHDTISSYSNVLFLGDVTDTPNMIDGRIMDDFVQVIGKREVVHVLGNHDRHGGTGDVSMGEILDRCLANYSCCAETRAFIWGQFAFVLASYYASEEAIMKAVEKAVSQSPKTLVFGHWNIYNDLMGGKKLPDDWLLNMNSKGALFILGHVHPPGDIVVRGKTIGAYIGVLSPSRFKESQGYCLEVDTDAGTIKKVDYTFGEEFIEFEYGEAVPPARYAGNANKYIKVTYDPALYDRETLKEILSKMFEGCKALILVAQPKEVEEVIAQVEELSLETEETFIRSIAEEKGFRDSDRLVEKHRKIKEEV